MNWYNKRISFITKSLLIVDLKESNRLKDNKWKTNNRKFHCIKYIKQTYIYISKGEPFETIERRPVFQTIHFTLLESRHNICDLSRVRTFVLMEHFVFLDTIKMKVIILPIIPFSFFVNIFRRNRYRKLQMQTCFTGLHFYFTVIILSKRHSSPG